MHVRTIAAILVALSLSALSFPSESIAQTMTGSWYGPGFQGQKMANGKRFNMYAFTVAHKTMRLGTRVCVTSLVNGKVAKAYVTDRGPYIKGRDIDLSYALGKHMGIIPKGTGKVNVVRC
jgi:rare lipoprotein A